MSSDSHDDAHDRLDEVIAEYVGSVEQGDQPDREQLFADYPDLADELREFFQHRDRMEDLLHPLRSAAARVLNVRCPHCRNSIELVDNTAVSDINCPSCGSHFSLVTNGSTYRFPSGLKRIGHFQLVDHVGTGQFGSVWKAKDLALERTVAIKIPRSRHLAKEEAEMFLRDARTAAQLNHPNIVGVHEVGKQDDTIYIVSDFIQGATLKQWMSTKDLTHREVAELNIKIARALHHAHEEGVIHRDLKPGNIMMDLAGEPHIVDFGLAKRESGEITMTLDGQILGSPAYMSPEQARGEGHTVDRRADIYSLGVMLYELLTGELPFRGDKQMLMVQILNDDPPPPRRLDSRVPRDMETICLKCLRKQPGQRYQTTEDLAADLTRWLEHKPIAARPMGFHEQAWSWCRRRPAIASLIGLLIAVLLGSALAAREVQKRERARRLVAQLASSDIERVPEIIQQLHANRHRVLPLLEKSQSHLQEPNTHRQTRTELALLELTQVASHAPPLVQRLLEADPPEFDVLAQALHRHHGVSSEELWELALSKEQRAHHRFRACGALASCAPTDDRWLEVADFVAEQLVSVPPHHFAEWADTLRPVREHLTSSLYNIFVRPDEWAPKRSFAAHSLATFLEQDVSRLYALLMESQQEQFVAFMPALARHPTEFVALLRRELTGRNSADSTPELDASQAQRLAYAAIAAYLVDEPELATSVLRASAQPMPRTRFIHGAIPCGVDPQALVSQLKSQSDASVKAALVLSLGKLQLRELSEAQRADVVQRVVEIHQQETDSGLQAAAEWLLAKWDFFIDASRPTTPTTHTADETHSGRYVNSEGHTMIVLSANQFQMGADDTIVPDTVIGRNRPRDRPQQQTIIGRTFALASHEVTLRQWARFTEQRPGMVRKHRSRPVAENDLCPRSSVNWYDAAAYCNWLSETEGIPASEWAYLPNQDGEFATGMKTSNRFAVCRGYRLPSDAEWEFACRAGTATVRPFGNDVAFMPEYACCATNSHNYLMPVGRFKPNDFGFFDILGNTIEWCHDKNHYLIGQTPIFDVLEPNEKITNRSYRMLRGGSYNTPLERLDSADRTWWNPYRREYQVGFRVARTVVPAEHDQAFLQWKTAQELGQKGHWKAAAVAMQQACQKLPSSPQKMWLHLSFVWQYLGEFEKANSVREELVQSFGNTQELSEAHNVATAHLFFLQQQPSEQLIKLCELSSQSASPLYQRDMGMLLYRQGRFKEATTWLEKADDDSKYDVGQACSLYFLAMSYHQAGDTQQASATRERADRLFNNYEAASADGEFGEYWYYWLANRVIRDEAIQVMGGSIASDEPESASDND